MKDYDTVHVFTVYGPDLKLYVFEWITICLFSEQILAKEFEIMWNLV